VALQCLALSDNELTGGLEPLRGCKKLEELALQKNKLTGDLEPLRDCAALQWLHCGENQLTPTKADKAHFEKQCKEFDMHPV
jgi:Leucine-rich repeat (LRR) protein